MYRSYPLQMPKNFSRLNINFVAMYLVKEVETMYKLQNKCTVLHFWQKKQSTQCILRIIILILEDYQKYNPQIHTH